MPGVKARLRLDADGRVTVSTAGHEMGMGTATVQAQHAADRLGVTLEDVSFEYGDSTLPSGAMAGGSSQTAGTVAAVTAAADALLAQVLKLAGNDSPLSGLRPSEVVARDLGTEGGGLAHAKDPSRHESYASILARAKRDAVEAEEGWSLRGEAFSDPRYGGVMNPSLAGSHVRVHRDVPGIGVVGPDIPAPRARVGARGIGEMGIPGPAAPTPTPIFNAPGRGGRALP